MLDKEKEKEKHKEREREREKYKERVREKHKEREKEKYKEREREREKEKEKKKEKRKREEEKDENRNEKNKEQKIENEKENKEMKNKNENNTKEIKNENEMNNNNNNNNNKEDIKKKRMEAWKRARELLNLPIIETKQEENQQEELKKDEIKQEEELKKDEIKQEELKDKMEEENLEDSKDDEEANNAAYKKEEIKNEENEIDSLDAFMLGVEKQLEAEEPLYAMKISNSIKKMQNSKAKSIGNPIEEEEKYVSDEYYSDEESSISKKLHAKVLPQIDHAKEAYISFRKNFYIEVPEIAKMSAEEVAKLRKEMDNIRVRGKGCPKPIKTFAQCGLSDKILKILKKKGYEKPTPIQCQAIPTIMSGKDVIGCAKTGSGKTLAFVLPMIRHIVDQPPLKPGEGPIGLIMAPTRELAMQIHQECKKFAKAEGLRCVCIYGGSGVASQISELKRGAEIIVCTPGRMIDVLCTNAGRVTNLKRVTYVVLDEADRMFDAGFSPQITRILNNIRPDRQTLMFSATFPWQMEALARQARSKPIEIIVGERSQVSNDITQMVEVISEENKWKRLLELVQEWYDKGLILIFVETQDTADKIFMDLIKNGFPCLSLHGGKDQQDRLFTIDEFKKKVKTILVATSVAARGLDVEDLNLVINFDVPNHMEDYVHRVGRTGRAGRKGTAITFITPDEEKYAPGIVKALDRSMVEVSDDLRRLVESYQKKKESGQQVPVASSGFGGSGYKFDEEEARKKQEERKRQKKEYGVDDDDEEEEDVDFDDEDSINNPNSQTNSIKSVQELAYQKIQEVVNRVKEAQRAAQIASGGDYFTDELEINDYPQQARWKVTRRDTSIAAIVEFTGCAITPRGSYFPPGKTPKPGERKLYLFIEGPSAIAVRNAKIEIRRVLEETAAISAPDIAVSNRYTI